MRLPPPDLRSLLPAGVVECITAAEAATRRRATAYAVLTNQHDALSKARQADIAARVEAASSGAKDPGGTTEKRVRAEVEQAPADLPVLDPIGKAGIGRRGCRGRCCGADVTA